MHPIILLLILLIVLVVVVLLYVSTRPNTFYLQRSRVIPADPDAIFSIVNDLSRWGEWSPFDKMDPMMKKETSTPSSGVNAWTSWQGNRRAGAGRMIIVEIFPPHKIVLRLEFTAPMVATHYAHFTLLPLGDNTEVTWYMAGELTYIAKIFHLFFNMDGLVGGQFEEGLTNLERVGGTKKLENTA